ncbi:MAG: hypothetical protein F6K36_05800 [Symploca sp. SIO3C6]|nr:hypothetical protein [Symploca sp. SIO3C6]
MNQIWRKLIVGNYLHKLPTLRELKGGFSVALRHHYAQKKTFIDWETTYLCFPAVDPHPATSLGEDSREPLKL